MIEKVEGPGSVGRTQPARAAQRTARAVGTGFNKHVDPASESEGISGGSTVGALNDIGAVLALQEVDDALMRARKGRRRAEDILDRLEEIRLALLTGGLNEAQLTQLVRMVAARRPDLEDGRLAEILDEIDLRARVELAKRGL